MQPTRMGDKLEKSSSKFSRSGLAPSQSSPHPSSPSHRDFRDKCQWISIVPAHSLATTAFFVVVVVLTLQGKDKILATLCTLKKITVRHKKNVDYFKYKVALNCFLHSFK